jgi:hypothetical protein
MGSWVKYPDNWHTDERVEDLSDSAIALLVFMLGQSALRRTEGVISRRKALRLRSPDGAEAVIAELVAAGFLEEREDSLFVVDWQLYLLSNARIEELSASRSASGRKGGFASGAARRRKSEANAEAIASKQTKQPRSKHEADTTRNESLLLRSNDLGTSTNGADAPMASPSQLPPGAAGRPPGLGISQFAPDDGGDDG